METIDELNVEGLIECLTDFYPDLRPSFQVEAEGNFVEREILPVGYPVNEDQRYEWSDPHLELSRNYGIMACGHGFFTFVSMHGDQKWTEEEVFWLALGRLSKYNSFIPVNPEDIMDAFRRTHEANPDADGEGLALLHLNSKPGRGVDGEPISCEESEALKDFLHHCLLVALSDAIFDSSTN